MKRKEGYPIFLSLTIKLIKPEAVKTMEKPTKKTAANLVPLNSTEALPNGASVVSILGASGIIDRYLD